MTTVVGAYVCPRGVFAVECRRRRGALEVVRTIDVPAALQTPQAAGEHLGRILRTGGIRKADVALAVRGFDIVHHVLALPPASDDMLVPIIERELRRLEPSIPNPVIAWSIQPAESDNLDAANQKQVLVAAGASDVAAAFVTAVRQAGHRLVHLTVLPAAFQRLRAEFDPTPQPTALVSPLPDGAFLGFFLGHALRLVVEPPLDAADAAPDAPAMAEEVELGAMFVRQQYRGAHIERVVVAASRQVFAESESPLSERLGLPVQRLALHELGAGALAGLGAIMDAYADDPLSLAGSVRQAGQTRPFRTIQLASMAAVLIAGMIGVWALAQALTARQAEAAIRDARQRIDQESSTLTPLRETADRRKLIRDATTALGYVARDRRELQQVLNSIAGAIANTAHLDSLHLDRGSTGWVAFIAGSVSGETNGRAVQALHDLYQDLPRRLALEGLSLEQLAYADSGGGPAVVRFRISFSIPGGKQ